MVKSWLKWFSNHISKPMANELDDRLHAYVSSKNPKTISDVERLEKEFIENVKNNSLK